VESWVGSEPGRVNDRGIGFGDSGKVSEQKKATGRREGIIDQQSQYRRKKGSLCKAQRLRKEECATKISGRTESIEKGQVLFARW